MMLSDEERPYPPLVEQSRKRPLKLDLIDENLEDGHLVLRAAAADTRIGRTVLFVNDYGMARAWQLWKDGVYPGNHLWGCIELVVLGYDVILPSPPAHSGLRRRLTNDWYPTLSTVRSLGPDDIVFCAHNVLLWTPLAKALRLARCKVVGQLFAREPLPLGNQYDAIIAHTPVAQLKAATSFPRVTCRHISWGIDLDFFEAHAYDPRWVLSCGKTFRDFPTMASAFADSDVPALLMHPDPQSLVEMPREVQVQSSRPLGEGIYSALENFYYRHATATLLTIEPDETHRHSIGLTNVLESIACGRPVVSTRTSAMVTELDIQDQGVGFFVPPQDPDSLRQVLRRVAHEPEEARAMGLEGRALCESYFNIDRFARDLHLLFQAL